MRITRASVLAVCVFLMLSGVACSGRQGGLPVNNIPSEHQNASTRQVGHSVGDVAPDFIIPLTTGETVSYSTLRSDRMPIFLFFFSPS